MTNETEPRALSAALSAPSAFVTRTTGQALHAANRHVERWAPEAEAAKMRPMRSLGFVDRMVAPWIETAQRSASLRLFSQYASTGATQRDAQQVSWVFPRPWYQDELDWMAAARQVRSQARPQVYDASPSGSSSSSSAQAPQLLTTRGTYVPPANASPEVAMPAALYEYVAPSLSIAAQPAGVQGVGFGGESMARSARGEAYSPLVSLASVQAAELMSRAVAPLVAGAPRQSAATVAAGAPASRPMTSTTVMTPGLRSVLTTILERAAIAQPVSRLAGAVPEMVTPPSPTAVDFAQPQAAPRRAPVSYGASDAEYGSTASGVADQYAEQRAQLVELQRVAQQAAQREAIARAQADAVRTQEASAAAQQAQQTAAQQAATQQAQQTAAQRAAALQATAQQTAAQREATQQAAAQRQAAQQAAQQAAAALEQRIAEQRAASVAAQRAAATAEQRAQIRAAAERAETELRQSIEASRASEAQQAVAQAAVQAAQQAAAQQAEAQSAAPQTAAERARAVAFAEAAERARLEQRTAQRFTERTPRLHDGARAEAAAHARLPLEAVSLAQAPSAQAAMAAMAAPAAMPAFQPSPEITAAIANLPPELAAMLGSTVGERPERTVQAIRELNDSLRTVELLSRASASGQAFEVTRGPRLMMPAGLGGLVSAVDRAQTISERPAALGGQRALAPLPLAFMQPAAQAPEVHAVREASRMPALTWLSPAARAQAAAPITALGATETAAPAALSHVAWADRWLARFAGATPQSLDMITAAGAPARELRMQALASAAPDVVFVVPELLRGDVEGERTQRRPGFAPSYVQSSSAQPSYVTPPSYTTSDAQPSYAANVDQAATEVPLPRQINAPVGEPLRRFDDDAETPDDVFAAISQAATRGRAARPVTSMTPTAAAAASPAPVAAPMPQVQRTTVADLVAHAAPSAPGAGLSAQLASSPFAPALRHVLPLASAQSFDVRALFGAGLGATYLAGLIGPASRELEIGMQGVPTWASWSAAPASMLSALQGEDRIDRLVPRFEPSYVQADALDALDGRTDEPRRGLPFGMPAQDAAGTPATTEQLRELEELREVAQAAQQAAATQAAGEPAQAAAIAAALERAGVSPSQLTTVRTALLSWEVAASATGDGAAQFVPTAFATSPTTASTRDVAHTSAAARAMIESMTLPMLGEGEGGAADQPIAWGSPGQVAERAQAWSVAQERSASDLALDFVTPELVLAARVYGLGPAEAAQAMRLAVSGAGSLGAMASLVDRTFVEAMAIGREARSVEAERARRAYAAGAAYGDVTVTTTSSAAAAYEQIDPVTGERVRVAPAMPVVQTGETPVAQTGRTETRAPITTAFPTADGAIAAAVGPARTAVPPASEVAFGVERRAPRGAFLWPAATISALGMNATGSDGQLSMSVAALELLAAQVVAELGTYTALSEASAAARGAAREPGASAPGSVFSTGGMFAPDAATPDAGGPDAATAGTSPAAALARGGFASLPFLAPRGEAAAEPTEADVLGAAAAYVPAARRSRFDALYVALSQSTEGRSWSPAARAARALALAGRSDGSAITARERAASAWDVLPVVYPNAIDHEQAAIAAVDAASGTASGDAGVYAQDGATSAAALMSTYLSSPRTARTAATSPASAAAAAARRGQRPGAPRDFVGAFDAADASLYVAPGQAGLAGLSARAGENLSSFVSPVAPPTAPVTSAASRAPSAMPEYVRTGRSGGRHGGGEVEIPSWFESAARKMLAERTGSDSDGISLAELTLVTSTPSAHIAASTKAPASPSPAPSAGSTAPSAANAPKIDVEKLAAELFSDIMLMMEVARSRNGDSL